MLTIKGLFSSQDLDRAAMSAVAGGWFSPSDGADDLFDFLGLAAQTDATAIVNILRELRSFDRILFLRFG